MGRILVIRGGAIGDFILTLPAIRLLRENFPDAEIEILGYRHIIALAENRFYAQATRSIEYASLTRFFIPNAELDESWASYFASFQQVISYLFDPDLFFETNLRRCGVKNFLVCSPKIVDSAHAAQQLAEPLQQLALYLDNPAPRIFPSREDEAAAEKLLPSGPGPLVALHPGSGSERKNWPLEHWRELGEKLLQTFPLATFLVTGGEADGERIEHLQRAWNDPRLQPLLHQPLPVLAAVLARCDLFLGHDSGISHLAAAVETRCILVFGPADPEVWAPQNPSVTILPAPVGNLAAISVEQVLAATRAVLN